MAADREIRLQQRILLLLERRYTRIIRAEIRRATLAMIAQYGQTRGDPQPDEMHEANMAAIMHDMALAAINAFGTRILDASQPFTFDDGKSFVTAFGKSDTFETKDFADFLVRIAAEYIAAEATRGTIRKITDTTRTQIIAQIALGNAEGWGVDKIARSMVSAIPSISRGRAALIARTETHNAANRGAFQSAQQVGIPLYKEWIRVDDDRIRSNHSKVTREAIPMDQPFRVPRSDGGEDLMMHAGDRDGGSAENTINCRCGVGYVRPPS